MFKLINKNIPFPENIPHIKRKIATVDDDGWTMIGDYLLRNGIDICPQEGIQEQICTADQDVVFACGDATMGKTFGGFIRASAGVGHQNYTARVVTKQMKDIDSESSYVRDMRIIFSLIDGCAFSIKDGAQATWRSYNNTIKSMHMNFNTKNPKEWEDCTEYLKTNQASFFYWDELTSVLDERVFLYSLSRNRDNSGFGNQTIATFNTKQNHWTYHWLKNAGYVKHFEGEPYPRLNPERVGVTMYFYAKDNNVQSIVWGSSKEEVISQIDIKITEKDKDRGLKPTDMVKSFTVLTGEASDNAMLVRSTRGGSIANLHNAGGKYRESLKGGYFVDDSDEDKLTVSQQMIANMWTNPIDADSEMYATLDVSGGGEKADNCPMWIFRGKTAIALKVFNGNLKELETWVRAVLNEYKIPMSNFCFDATGIGQYLKAYTSGRPITGNMRPIQEVDEAGNVVVLEQYFNLRSQLIGRTKVMLEKGEISINFSEHEQFQHGKWKAGRSIKEIMIEESNIFMQTTRNNKIYYRSKDEFRDRFKYSPDYMDAFWQIAVFHLSAKERKEIEPELCEHDYAGLYEDNEYEYYYEN